MGFVSLFICLLSQKCLLFSASHGMTFLLMKMKDKKCFGLKSTLIHTITAFHHIALLSLDPEVTHGE